VLHLENADPDLGRKGFQPELEDFGKLVSTLVVNSFLQWRKHLKKETGAPPDIVSKKNIHDWITAQEEHERQHPLIIARPDVFLPTNEPSITSMPLNEQDVIALFNQLLAGGVIRGVRLMSASTHNQYDGVFRFCLKKPTVHHIYNKQTNPLGIDEGQAQAEFVSEPRILEYKYSLDGLIVEVEKADKKEDEICLLVAWEMGKKWQTRYEVTSLLDLDNIHHRYFHGGTHLIKNSVTGTLIFPAIILSDLIDFVNDPDGVQSYQKSAYVED
jgi:hypothetical protein